MADLTVKGLIELVLKGRGGKDAADQMGKVKKGADAADKSVKKAKASTESFGKTLVKYFGGALLARFALQSVNVFAAWQRQLRVTANEARRLGLDIENTTDRATNLTIAMEKQTGILRQDTLPVFNRFLGLTEDVERATLLTRAAVGAEEGGFKDLNTAAALLGSTLLGEVIEPAKSIGYAFDQSRSAAEQQAEVLTALIEKMLSYSKGIDDTKGKLDGINAKFNEQKLILGERLAPAVEWIGNAFGWIVMQLQLAGDNFGTFFSMATQGFTGIGNVMRAAFDFKKLMDDPSMFFKTLTETVKREVELQTDIMADGVESAKRIRAKGAETIAQTEAAQQKALAEFQAQANTRAASVTATRLEKEAAIERKKRDERIAFEMTAEDQILASKIAGSKQGSVERERLELEALDRAHRIARDKAIELGADLALIDEQFRVAKAEVERAADETRDKEVRDRADKLSEFLIEQQKQRIEDAILLTKEGSDAELALQIEFLELMRDEELLDAELLGADLFAVRKKWADRITNLEHAHTNARIKWAELEAREKSQYAQTIAGAAVQFAQAAFGESKALAIAAAIINTWGAVNAALNSGIPFPGNVILAGLMAATGLANVAKIRSTNIGDSSSGGDGASLGGGGFDDPVNDRLARVGGRRWAMDLINNVDRGFNEGLAGAPDQPDDDPTRDRDEPPIVINGNVYGGRVGLRQLSRDIQRATRTDSRTRSVR